MEGSSSSSLRRVPLNGRQLVSKTRVAARLGVRFVHSPPEMFGEHRRWSAMRLEPAGGSQGPEIRSLCSPPARGVVKGSTSSKAASRISTDSGSIPLGSTT